ncbi:unnamed protein product, partial [Soboliphyme baturini]|uniref:C2H2-type domain-containing protein n=1 Tax=Soboliphyme baturini TaxID=241478 RepID=A0A183IUI0_9BILA
MAASKSIDESVVTCSLETGVNGIELVVQSMKHGTDEVKDLLDNECTLLYECRICKNLFRNVTDLVVHKREYCPRSVLAKSVDEFSGDTGDSENGKLNHDDVREDGLRSAQECTTGAEDRPGTEITMNLLKSLTKRLLDPEEAETLFIRGYQSIRRRPSLITGLRETETAGDNSDGTMVSRNNAPMSRQHSMELRLRGSNDSSKFVKTVSREELAIVTRLECCDSCDLMTLTCLVDRCKRTFPDIETLAFHLNYSHVDIQPPGVQMCFLCGRQVFGSPALASHLQLRHRSIARRHTAEVMKRWADRRKKCAKNCRRQKQNNGDALSDKAVPHLSTVLPILDEPFKQSAGSEDIHIVAEKRHGQDTLVSKPPAPEANAGQVRTGTASLNSGAVVVPINSANPKGTSVEQRVVTFPSNGKKEAAIMLFDKSRNIVLQLKSSSSVTSKPNEVGRNYIKILPKFILTTGSKVSTLAAQQSNFDPQAKPSTLTLMPRMQVNHVPSWTNDFTLPILTLSDVERALTALYVGFLAGQIDSEASKSAACQSHNDKRSRSRPLRRLKTSGEELPGVCAGTIKNLRSRRLRVPPHKALNGKQQFNGGNKALVHWENPDIETPKKKQSPNINADNKSPPPDGTSPATKTSPHLRVRRALKSPYSSKEYANTWPQVREERSRRAVVRHQASRREQDKERPKEASDSRCGTSQSSPAKATSADDGDVDKFPVIFTKSQRQQIEELADLKNFVCRRCGNQFTTRCNTERHCYAHLCFVRFRCRLCSTAAFYRSDMKRHLLKQCTKINTRVVGPKHFQQNIVPCCESQPGKVVSWRGYPVVWTHRAKPRATKIAMMLAKAQARESAAAAKKPPHLEVERPIRQKKACTVWENGALNDCEQSSTFVSSSSGSQLNFVADQSPPAAVNPQRPAASNGGSCSGSSSEPKRGSERFTELKQEQS